MRVRHVITDLDTGGAQVMLVKLLAKLDRGAFSPEVFTLSPDRGEPLRADLRRLGVPVRPLGVSGYGTAARAVFRLASAWRRSPPDLVQTWLHPADFAGLAAARLAGRGIPVVWNLRQSNLDPALNRRSALAVIRVCAALSRRGPDAILANSAAARDAHAGAGYDASKIRVIPNGFDTDLFRPDPAARASARREIGVDENVFLFSWVGRLDPQKNPLGFLRAVGRWREVPPSARFLLCGKGLSRDAPALARAAAETGHGEKFLFLGPRADVPRLWAASDAAVSSSLGESFPNALGEALSCGLPCVATDVGDVKALVGASGLVVPAGDDGALAEALDRAARWTPAERRALGEGARRRVIAEFSLDAVAASYADVYRALAAGRGVSPS